MDEKGSSKGGVNVRGEQAVVRYFVWESGFCVESTEFRCFLVS